MLLGDLNIIWETAESSDDDFWKDQEEWEIIRWRFHESSVVHTLEIEDGTMESHLAREKYASIKRVDEKGAGTWNGSTKELTSPRVNGYLVKAHQIHSSLLKRHVAEKNNLVEAKDKDF
ncbi:hypothetical protein Tco_1320478 [Tanacetum coccineum]